MTTESATRSYKTRMEEFLSSSPTPPSNYELRQQHQLIAFECMDEFRKGSTLNNGSEWQVEAALKVLYQQYAAVNRTKRVSTNNSPMMEGIDTSTPGQVAQLTH